MKTNIIEQSELCVLSARNFKLSYKEDDITVKQMGTGNRIINYLNSKVSLIYSINFSNKEALDNLKVELEKEIKQASWNEKLTGLAFTFDVATSTSKNGLVTLPSCIVYGSRESINF